MIFDKFLFLIVTFLLSVSLLAQAPRIQQKVLHSSTTIDSIQVRDVQKKGVFLEIKSFFEEYSATKPGSVSQFQLVKQKPDGTLVVRYILINELVSFRLDTLLEYSNNSKHTLVLDASRRVPLEVQIMLRYVKGRLQVDLL